MGKGKPVVLHGTRDNCVGWSGRTHELLNLDPPNVPLDISASIVKNLRSCHPTTCDVPVASVASIAVSPARNSLVNPQNRVHCNRKCVQGCWPTQVQANVLWKIGGGGGGGGGGGIISRLLDGMIGQLIKSGIKATKQTTF